MGKSNPIKHVYLSIGFSDTSKLTIENFNTISKIIKRPDSKITPISNSEIIFKSPDDISINNKQIGITIEDGLKLTGVRENDIFVLRKDEYTNWENFKVDSIETLLIILDNLKITEIDRVFLQFINEFFITGSETILIEDYFRFYPQTNTLGDPLITGSNTNVSLYDEKTKVFTRLNHQFEQEGNDTMKISLDIHSGMNFIDKNYNNNLPELLNNIQSIHDYAKDLFISCLTKEYLNEFEDFKTK